ncbi:MAG: DUF4965 domain-containing protein [Prevotella sp.]|jgi:hypothetical protein|nr:MULTISPECIES: glutaminase family protein [unclassified Prevotella]MCH3970367.1 DUF4965 domain-containing protein [Prevotella sp.]MCH4186464.1 DUF4965 domain-containing protein [Prevotella sp.]MCH4251649.1 DUF4965 domain-containing protein [Prevotella sp.]
MNVYKKLAIFLFALCAGVSVQAQTPEFFQPYRATHLRLPSVPLVVNDPYFSIWSPYDHLTDGPTAHWTGSPKPLDGLLRVDGTVYRFMGSGEAGVRTARQESVSVLATDTYYSFECGPVELNLVFTAPMLIHDLDLISTPVNYISYQVSSKDKKSHDVQLYLSASPEIAQNTADQPTRSRKLYKAGMEVLESGTIDQPILAKKGDGICIDWGYVYLPAVNGKVSLGTSDEVRGSFISSGRLPAGEKEIFSYKSSTSPVLAYVHDFGQVSSPISSFAMLGYDEVQDIEYMYHRYKGYWARNGKTIFEAFKDLGDRYSSIMDQCRSLDKTIYDDGLKSGDVQYAEILSGSYRHVMAAHKLFEDKDGHLLFFSKENNSNGCVNTVDLTYPEAPLFFCYNPTLEKAMMTSIFEYSRSGRYTKPFAAHDQGTYPIADGQVYGGDMPVEESGNMLILSSMLCQLDGNTHYVDPYWDILTTWADYLVKNGQDPANQLCTDDFAGHWAHNCNLSVKAIMGIEGYARMAALKGEQSTAEKYGKIARDMAQWWSEHAKDGDHYRLSFDRPGTWSQKYNMIWDKLWATHLFPKGTMEREISYYLKHQNKYGLPLDCRKTYTKSDWIMWTAAMSPNTKTFLKFVAPVYRYINETPSRVPISDWHETTDGKMVGFKARSVIGGYWMKVLEDKLASERTANKGNR